MGTDFFQSGNVWIAGLSFPIRAALIVVTLFAAVMGAYLFVSSIFKSLSHPDLQPVRMSPRSRSGLRDVGYIYLIKDAGGMIKIGAAKDVQKRLKHLQTAVSSHLTLIYSVRVNEPLVAEAGLHRRYVSKCKRGEWFALTDKDVAEIKAMFTK
jgi:hypothetical protein